MSKPMDISRKMSGSDRGSSGIGHKNEEDILEESVNRLAKHARVSFVDRLIPYLFAIGLALLTAYVVTRFVGQIPPTNDGVKTEDKTTNTGTDASQTEIDKTDSGLSFTYKKDEPAATTPAPAVATTTDKKSAPVRILNGSGVVGQAGEVKTKVEAGGWTVVSVGNAKKFDYETSIIYYLTGKKTEAELLAKDIPDLSTTLEEKDQAFVGTDTTLLLVVGKK